MLPLKRRYAYSVKHSKRNDHSLLGGHKKARKEEPVTVCIAAIAENMVLLAADRMITAGDIRFEPETEKILFLTSSIAVMFSGDSSLHGEIMQDLHAEVQRQITRAPLEWLTVKQITDWYVKFHGDAKRRRSAAAVLAPLNLESDSWLEKTKTMDADLADKLARDLINFEMPFLHVIIAGIDLDDQKRSHAHIYTYENEYGSIASQDYVSFASVGSGSRHAESQFMLARHSWKRPLAETLLLIYSAKRDAEVAPGVGDATDLFAIGPYVGQATPVFKPVIDKLEYEYQKIKRAEKRARKAANREVTQYVADLATKPVEEQSKPPSTDGEVPPSGEKP